MVSGQARGKDRYSWKRDRGTRVTEILEIHSFLRSNCCPKSHHRRCKAIFLTIKRNEENFRLKSFLKLFLTTLLYLAVRLLTVSLFCSRFVFMQKVFPVILNRRYLAGTLLKNHFHARL